MHLSPELYETLYARHGHRCPMSTLGLRMGHAARRQLPREDLPESARYLSRTCAVDGVELATDCRRDHRLVVEERGRHELELTTTSGLSFRVRLLESTLQRLETHRREKRLGLANEGATEALIDYIRQSPEAELFIVQEDSR